MEKSPKRLDRPSFWKWAIPLVLGLVVLTILGVSGAARSVGGVSTFVIVVSAMAFVRLVLVVLLAMALARRFRDIGWPAWIGPTILLVAMFSPPFLVVGYVSMTYADDIREWASMLGWISDSVSLALLVVAGSMPGKSARAEYRSRAGIRLRCLRLASGEQPFHSPGSRDERCIRARRRGHR